MLRRKRGAIHLLSNLPQTGHKKQFTLIFPTVLYLTMNINLLKAIPLAAVIILSFCCDISASGFIGIGSGAVYSGSDSGTDNSSVSGFGIPILLEYQYAHEYRGSWLFDSSFSYTVLPGDDAPGNIMIFTAGVMYIKPFTFYQSNVTEKTIKKNSCLGLLLLPVTTIRDSLNNIFQYMIPQHLKYSPALRR